MCASIHCQVYGGFAAENEKTTAAVNATAGEVITYNGELIDAVYSASSGGYTESAVNVWGTDFPYLRAAEDPYEGRKASTVTPGRVNFRPKKQRK